MPLLVCLFLVSVFYFVSVFSFGSGLVIFVVLALLLSVGFGSSPVCVSLLYGVGFVGVSGLFCYVFGFRSFLLFLVVPPFLGVVLLLLLFMLFLGVLWFWYSCVKVLAVCGSSFSVGLCLFC